MTEQAKVPAIRFAGFTDPWEQRKLGELFFESNERSSSMEILSVSVAKGDISCIRIGLGYKYQVRVFPNYKVVHKEMLSTTACECGRAVGLTRQRTKPLGQVITMVSLAQLT